jgi:hypothetical protein
MKFTTIVKQEVAWNVFLERSLAQNVFRVAPTAWLPKKETMKSQ